MIESAVFYGFLAMVGFGVANASSQALTKEYGVVRAIFLRNVFVVVLIAASLWLLRTSLIFDPVWLEIGAIIALASYGGFWFFMRAIHIGKIGVVVPVASAQIVISAVFGFLMLGDTFTLLKTATALVVFTGVVLTSVDFKNFRSSDLFSVASGVPYSLMAALVWGIVFPLYKFPSLHLGSLFYGFEIEIVVLLTSFVQICVSGGSITLWRMTPRLVLLTVLTTVGTAIGTVFLNFGYATGEIALVTAIYGAVAVVALATAAILYRERLTKQQYFGALVVVVGIMLPVLSFI